MDRSQRRAGGAREDHATRWRLIKSPFSMGLPVGRLRASHAARQERGVWQRRFRERHVRSDEELVAAVRCCWINPVKHGPVERLEDWAWLFIHRDRPI